MILHRLSSVNSKRLW